MRWPELTAQRVLAVGMALFLVLSLAAVHGALRDQPPDPADSNTTAEVGDTSNANTPAPPNPNAIRLGNRTATLNCSALAARSLPPDSRSPATALNTSRPAFPSSHNTVTHGTAPAASVGPGTGNGTTPATGMRRAVPASVRETCRLIEQYSPPEWMTEMAAHRTTTAPDPATDGAANSVETYRNRSDITAVQLALAGDLRDILTADSRSRRGATFAAAELALAERRAMAATGDRNVTVQPQLAAQQTKLRGTRDLLRTAETDSTGEAHSLSRKTKLTETAFKVQVARQKTETQPVNPSDVTLSTTTVPTPDHDTPVVATVAILEAHNTELTDAQAAELQALGALPLSARQELTDVLDAYLVYYRTAKATNGTDGPRVRAAQLQLLDAAADLEAVLDDADASGPVDSVSQEVVRPTIQIAGVVSIDLSTTDNTYTEDYKLQIDAGGDDIYNNNAGGANASGTSTDVAALIDLGGSDTYNGRNGGGQYLVTEASPSVPDNENPENPIQRPSFPKKGEAAGFLLDAGTGDDTYNAEGHGSNGGARRGLGFLVDAGGDDTYNGSDTTTNGAGTRKGTGFLLDAGTGNDAYDGGDKGPSNGGAKGGRGFLFDVGGDDTYNGSNGGANRGFLGTNLPIRCITDPREDNLQDPLCRIIFSVGGKPQIPQSGGFLLDGGGIDTYHGINGGAGFRGAGFLLDAGTGDDRYDGKNGGANRRGATGVLLDLGGDDTYKAGNGAQNGGGHVSGYGFLMDGGTGDDTYDATTEGGTEHWQRQDLPPGSRGTNGGGWQNGRGFLADGGGDDNYIAGSVATNGGATRGLEPEPGGGALPSKKASGFLLDVAGNDTYTAKEAAVNGGADSGVGLLYDNAGTDFYKTLRQRCRDCSDVPKGTVGAQVDRGSAPRRDGTRVGPAEVLVVDDDARTATADCPDASYQAIQPAVDDAEFGDTVRVCAGTYPGNVTIDTSNVTLRAAGSGTVVLDGAHKRRFGVALVAARTTVTGFTARNFSKTSSFVGEQPENAAFLAIGPQATVSHNVIRDGGFGVIAAGLYTDSLLAETPLSEGEEATLIHNNTVTNTTLGLAVGGTGNVKVARNTVRETPRGIVLLRADEVTVQNNTVSGQAVPSGTEQRGISAVRSSEITMTDNTVRGFTTPANRTRPAGTIGDGIGIEIRTPEGGGGKPTHILRNNTMAANTYNLHVTSGRRSAYQHISIGPSNTVNGEPVLYLVGATNTVIGPGSSGTLPIDALVASDTDTNRADLPSLDALETPGYVACVSCTNVTVRDLELGHNGQGVLVVKSSGTRIDNVTVHDTLQGISVQGSPSNTEVTHSTVRESFKGIVVRHNCANTADVAPIITSRFGRLLGGDQETCAIPSVLLANNTIQQAGLLGTTPFIAKRGYGIRVTGTGVTVRGNTITDSFGEGITMRRAAPPAPISTPGPVDANDLLPDSVPNPLVLGNTISLANSSVIDNTIVKTSVGVRMQGNHGPLVRGNSISDVGLGLLSGHNEGVMYRNNVVRNATIGMYIRFTETELTARNNSFRDVSWGLDGEFRYLGASATHNIGPSNTVNGERILWLTGAVGRTIDASDANMVVCVNCVDVTIEDMTLGDNGYGVMLWGSTGTRVTDVTIEDAVKTGVLIRGGQNITVRNTTIIDSMWPIYTMPNPVTSRAVRRDVGRLLPTGLPRTKQFVRNSLGSVRIVNNRVLVDDASWPEGAHRGPPGFAEPGSWGHFGIFLFNPSKATVTGNHVTGNRWGIFHWRGEISELRITNNTITNPRKEQGLARFGGYFLGPYLSTLGIVVQGSAADGGNATTVIRNNTLSAGTSPPGGQKGIRGIVIKGEEVPTTTVTDNRVQGYGTSVVVRSRSNNTTVSLRRNRLVGAKSKSVSISARTPGSVVKIHQNLLNPGRFGYGVKYNTKGGGGGGHMMSGGGGDSGGGHAAGEHQQPVDATCNRWAAPSGPSSHRMTVVDPLTGKPADGNGSAVSHGHMHGRSNVHFHPWIGESPGRSCAKAVVGTATPTPTPGPTRTPWPTAEPGPGDGTGPGPGNGTGPGPGNGTAPGPGPATEVGGGEGTSTATARVPATATPTGTPPTVTPEIVPGFGVAGWLVAFVLLVAVLAARRRD